MAVVVMGPLRAAPTAFCRVAHCNSRHGRTRRSSQLTSRLAAQAWRPRRAVNREGRRRQLSDAQRARMRAAYRAAGPQAVAGFRQVLEAMMDPDMRRRYHAIREAGT